MEAVEDQMLYVTFNQDYSAFAVGTERGFRIYNAYPFKDYYERILEGGIGIVEMLYKSNIIALVGGGKYPKHSRNKIILWDDFQAKVMTEISFTTYIKNVKMKKDKIIIVCDTKIYVFNMLNFQNIDTVDTFENSQGIIAITYDPIVNLLAFPDKAVGYVKLKNYDKNETFLINAHNSKIACLAFSPGGLFLATASEKGTFIRIFRSDTGEFLHEYQRGTDMAEIYSLTFDGSVQFIACSASTGTIHIFSLSSAYKKLKEGIKLEEKKRKSPLLSPKDKVTETIVTRTTKTFWDRFTFFKTESSWSEFKIPEKKSIVAFHSDSTIIVISSEGRYYVAKFSETEEKPCIKIEEINLNIGPSI